MDSGEKNENTVIMKILITGGAGFIGSEMVRQLANTNAEIIVIDSLTYAGNMKSLSTVLHKIQFKKIDISDLFFIKSFI